MKPLPTTLSQLAHALHQRQLSAVEVTQGYLDRIEQLNPRLNAFINVSPEVALKQARMADKRFASATATPLTGIPFCLKDVYVTRSVPTTAASLVLDQFRSPYNATVYQKLIDAGAVLVGKNNQDAWGHGGSSENTDFGPVKNPWDTSRTAGGSSGGTAAAIAADMAVFGIGEDTGGSIRNPSSYCNLTGLKVSYGRVSRYGAIAYASSLDTVGPMARTAQECASVLEAIAGFDPQDASSSREPVPVYSQHIQAQLPHFKIGLVEEFTSSTLDKDSAAVFDRTQATFKKLGCHIKKVSLPLVDYAVPIYYLLALSETSSNLARYDGVRFGASRALFTPETMRRILLGTFSLSAGYSAAYYQRALKARTQLIHEFTQAFRSVDAILAPVTPFPPYQFGQLDLGDEYAISMYLADLYTCSINPAGLPSLAFPAGFTPENVPIGLQLIGPMFTESRLLQLVHHFQSHTHFHRQGPPL